jgi:MFS family permease
LSLSFRLRSGPTKLCDSLKQSGVPDLRRNYALQLIAGGFLFIAIQFGNTRLVVPWIGAHLGVAYLLVAAILPVLQLGQIVGQLGSAPYIARARTSKTSVVATSLMLAVALAAVIVAVKTLPAQVAAVVLLLCMLVFGACHGALNVGYENLLAHTIVPRVRGRLMADRASLGGLVAVLLGLLVMLLPADDRNGDDVLWWAVAGWLGMMLAYAALREPACERLTEPFSWQELLRGLRLIGVYRWYRDLLLANTLLLSVELAIPFYAIHAATLTDVGTGNVTLFVITSSVGVLISGLLWKAFSVRGRIIAGAMVCALGGALTFLVQGVDHGNIPYYYAFLFILLTLGEQGSIQGRLTYLDNRAPEHDRPILVATTSTAGWVVGIGVSAVLAAAGSLSDIRTPLVILIFFNLASALYVWRTLEPDDIPAVAA